MQTYGNPDVTYGWWAGNAGVTNKSGKFIAAHIAHTGLIAFAAGGSTLWELARYNPEIPMGHQSSIFLAHLASIGIGFDEAGAWTGAGVASIAIVHLVLSMVYGAGGLLHSVLFVGDMQDSEVPQARKFKLEWDNPDNQTFILGHHLLFFGVACIWFVEWARIHGIYDPAIGAVRQVEYNLNLTSIWNHQFDFLAIDSLEDVLGGHAFLAFFLLIGGVFHIVTKNFGEYTEFKGKGLLSAESVLSYSLAGAAYMAFVAAFWCSSNTTIYPIDLYGEVLKLQFEFAPYFSDTATNLPDNIHTARAWLSNAHFFIGFFFLQGHLWHALRGMGFNFKRIGQAFENMEEANITSS